MEAIEAKARLLDILAYLRAIEPQGIIPTQVAAQDLIVTQAQASALPGFTLEPEAEVYLRVAPPSIQPAPSVPERLQPWIRPSDDPSKPPQPLGAQRPTTKSRKSSTASATDPTDSHYPEVLASEVQAYLQQWQVWAQQQQPRYLTRQRYDALFRFYKDLKLDGGAESLEIVVGMGWAHWQTTGGQTVRAPLLLQACEITLTDQHNGGLEIHPAHAPPRLDTRALEAAGVDVALAHAHWKERLAQGAHLDIHPLAPDTYLPLLKSLAQRLDALGQVVESKTADPFTYEAGPQLAIVPGWAFFLRKRPNDRILNDLNALSQAIEVSADLPPVVRNLVDNEPQHPPEPKDLTFRGLEPVGLGEGCAARELYFPLPYNAEQVLILKKLQSQFGVVVQGPPGTGKSHTIANIIAHYLAEGKSILVTSSTAGALEVVRSKLPDGLRDLAVTLLSSDAESFKQFEQSIAHITQQISSFDLERHTRNTAHLRQQIDATHSRIQAIDGQIQALAQRHIPAQAGAAADPTPATVVQAHLSAQAPRHAWLTESTPLIPATPALVEAVEQARAAHQQLGSHLNDALHHQSLPTPEDIPAVERVMAAIANRLQIHVLEQAFHLGTYARLTPEALRHLDDDAWLDLTGLEERYATIEQLTQTLEAATSGWTTAHDAAWLAIEADDPLAALLTKLERHVPSHWQRMREQTGRFVLDDQFLHDSALAGALDLLAQGQPPFPWWGLRTPAAHKQAVAQAKVDGRAAQTLEDWQALKAWNAGRVITLRMVRDWNRAAQAFDLPTLGAEDLAGLHRRLLRIQQLRALHQEAKPALEHHLLRLFGRTQHPATLVHASVQAARDLESRRAVDVEWEASLDALSTLPVFGPRLALGLRAAPTPEAGQTLMGQVQAELTQAIARQTLRRQLEQAVAQIAQHGATQWAQRLAEIMAPTDTLVPEHWRETWELRCLCQYVPALGEHADLRDLFAQRSALTQTLSERYQQLISELSWARVVQNATPKVRQALQRYSSAVRSLGKGTGKRAARFRAEARAAMEEAYRAVPCWIMPHGRVSESMPADLGLFDLVIVDEASQSDIRALPCLLRAKQVLVVGDSKQVSPSAVGKAEESILELHRRFFSDRTRHPHASNMTQDKSLYDLFSVVFAGNDIMLREHFRSVEAIIEYSNREFYGGKIIPLRSPPRSERLDPPLIDVHVRNGVREGDCNPNEAMAIVEEIERILADPALRQRSIGVVTLTSNDRQALLINDLLRERFTPDILQARKLTAGPPPRFQGQERDIILVSAVQDLSDARSGPKEREETNQRFNVALSRARDRMYLFRSFTPEQVRPNSPLRPIVEHFQAPFGEQGRQVEHRPPRTPFERLLFDWLTEGGYDVQAQAGSQGYRIDLVVEGSQGQRLAIECDGDEPERQDWADQLRRQRVLERAGWTFWRVFQAHYQLDPESVLADLQRTLREAGITPQDARRATAWVASLQVGEPVSPVPPDSSDGPGATATQAKHPDIPSADAGRWPTDYNQIQQACDSDFERIFLRVLLHNGFRVWPQYPMRGYRLDLLVQGPDGKRLAIECDGDSFHGLDRQDQDRKRQAYLEQTERLAFWRCFYSDYQANPKAQLASLQQALASAGVRPFPREPSTPHRK